MVFFISFLTFIIVFNFTFFYLDDYKLSTNIYIRFLQIWSPILFILIVITLVYLDVITINAISCLADKNTSNAVNIGANVEINRDAAEALGRNVGMAGTIAGVSAAVAKGIAKSSLPPLQKAGVIVSTGVAGGAIFIGTSAINRVVNTVYYTTTPPGTSNTTGSNLPGGINKLLGDSFSSGANGSSDLMLLILSIDILTCVCLSLVFILFMIILFKFYLNEDKIKLNLSSLIGDKANCSLNYYFIKIIKLNKKTSVVYIFFIFIILFIALAFNCYFISELYNNIDKFVDLHINSRK